MMGIILAETKEQACLKWQLLCEVLCIPMFSHVEKLFARLEQEFKSLQRHKAAPEDSTAATSSGVKDQPLFTLNQLSAVCQRMLKEREGQIREEYDRVLASKLAGTVTAIFSEAF